MMCMGGNRVLSVTGADYNPGSYQPDPRTYNYDATGKPLVGLTPTYEPMREGPGASPVAGRSAAIPTADSGVPDVQGRKTLLGG